MPLRTKKFMNNPTSAGGEKAVLKRTDSKCWRAWWSSYDLAKRLECGAFTAAFARGVSEVAAASWRDAIQCLYLAPSVFPHPCLSVFIRGSKIFKNHDLQTDCKPLQTKKFMTRKPSPHAIWPPSSRQSYLVNLKLAHLRLRFPPSSCILPSL